MPSYQVKRKGPAAYQLIEADTLDAAVEKLVGQPAARTGSIGSEIAFGREVVSGRASVTAAFHRANS